MSPGGSEPPRPTADTGRPAPRLGWRARLETLQRSVMRQPFVLSVMHVLRAYERAGGAMLAGGLSYFGFFTMVPGLLLFVSVLALVIGDSDIRERIIEGLIEQVDPISDVAREVIDGLADSGRTGTIVGVLGLLWGASGFYGALQNAMQRLFPGPGTRDVVQTRLRGALAVALVLASLLSAVVLIFIVPLVTTWLGRLCVGLTADRPTLAEGVCSIDFGRVSELLGPLAAVLVAFLAALVVYVAIPPDGPSLRQAILPAALAGIGIGLLTSLFGVIAQLLFSQWVALGILGSVFIALLWFNFAFQILLFCAAFARLRRDRDRLNAGPPTF